MKVYAGENPGEITDLGDGTYFKNSNIVALSDPDTGDGYFEFDAELSVWPTASVVPEEVYAWRLRLITQLEGLKGNIDSLLDQLEEPAQTIAREAWTAGVTIRRDSPLVAQLTTALSLTTEQVDNLFLEANAIEI